MVLRLKARESRSLPGLPIRTTEPPQCHQHSVAGWSSPVARQAHNLKVPGSNPGPATIFSKGAICPPREKALRLMRVPEPPIAARKTTCSIREIVFCRSFRRAAGRPTATWHPETGRRCCRRVSLSSIGQAMGRARPGEPVTRRPAKAHWPRQHDACIFVLTTPLPPVGNFSNSAVIRLGATAESIPHDPSETARASNTGAASGLDGGRKTTGGKPIAPRIL